MLRTLMLAAVLAFLPQEGNQATPRDPKKAAPMTLRVSVGRYFSSVRFVWAVNARGASGGGGSKTPNYWQARPLRKGETSLPWNADIHWSLGHKPLTRETAIFDAGWSTTPCHLSIAAAAPAAVVFDTNWTSTLTVTSSLWTPSLTVNFGNAGGPELIVRNPGQILVIGTMTFSWAW